VCSDIGGMAEKVRHGVDGYHVAAANVLQWARALTSLSKYGQEWDELRAGIRPPLSYAGCCAAHLELFASQKAEVPASQAVKPGRRVSIPVRAAA